MYTEHQNATRIAVEAGQRLLTLRQRLLTVGVDIQALRSEADREAHNFIIQALQAAYPHDPVLSEEGIDDQERLKSRRAWIVDPLDGTREFGEWERTDWAIHVALVTDEQPVVAAVALPARNLVLSTDSPPEVPERKQGPWRIVVSRTRPSEIAQALAGQLHAELLGMGSAGAKTMSIVLGDADIYVHSGGQYEWDSAAPIGVAAAAGLHVSRLDGSALRYNQPDPWLPDVLVCRPELAEEVLKAIKICTATMSS